VVSGDYCDVVIRDCDPSNLLVLFGDVAGKGVSASLLMSHLHAMFRSLATQRGGIDQMIEQANRLLCASTRESHYATLVCVETTADGWVEICNAGHCSPLVFRADGSFAISATGLPLGLFGSGSFQSTKIRLEPGDLLLLYSDGLIESENPSGEEYGVDRLQASLCEARGLPSAEAVVQFCRNNLSEFLGGTTLNDDLSLMAIRRV
jgi:sigma-B regulation protein RsbU (phosphoserine phosphatase)